jgi:hypothetical protein
MKKLMKLMFKMNLNKRIFVGVTCTSARRNKDHWRLQLKEINLLGIKEITLFPTTLKLKERKVLYKELEQSSIKKIKLVHLRGEDFTEEELEYFYKRWKTRLFNCHDEYFDNLYKKFPKFRKNIILEPNYDGKMKNKLLPGKMGGFCIDLAHLKAAKERHKMEWDYVMQHLQDTKFMANHLNGYSKRNKKDLHFVNNVKEFDYLKELPKKTFSKVIALELENTIKEQLKFKEYIVRMMK